MKNYVIAAVVIILIIGGIVWFRGRTATPVDMSDTATTTVTDLSDTTPVASTTDEAGTTTVAQ